MNNGIQYLQNFADNFNFKVVEKIHEDKRKKNSFFLTENGTTISPKLDYNGINHFLLGVKYSQKKEGKNNSINLFKKTRKNLKDVIIEETLKLINNSKKTNYYIKIGWIDFVSDDLVQYEIVGVCRGMNNKVLLVHEDNSEGASKGDIFFMHQIKSIDVLESILKAVKKNREPLQELFESTIPKINAEIIANQTPEKFARKCDATNEGMNEGFCFGDGEKYFKYKKDAKKYAKKIGYSSLKEAYRSDAYYHTEWMIEEDEDYFDINGNQFKQ